MRRVLTFLMAAVLLLVSLGIGLFTADLPFWRRALQVPLAADGFYLPVAPIGTGSGAPLAVSAPAAIAPEVLEQVAARARNSGSRALLVMHHDQLLLERYFAADDAGTLLPAGVIARPLVAMAVGVALREGQIESLDAPISRYLPEWEHEPRGAITLRQLLEETSGLESGGNVRAMLARSPFAEIARLPRFATSRGVRMLLGNDYESTALTFALEHEPGGFHNTSPANAQLVAVILERATGLSYEDYLDERIWRRAGAGRAELQLDRRSGMPAAHCCWRATARDMVRVASLLATGGVHGTEPVLPEGWTRQMAGPSRVDAAAGLLLHRAIAGDLQVLSVTDAAGSSFWVIPERGLTVLSIGNGTAGASDDLPLMLAQALAVN